MSIQGRLYCQMSHDNNFQFSELFGLHIRAFGPAVDFKLFLSLECIIVIMPYRKINILFLKLQWIQINLAHTTLNLMNNTIFSSEKFSLNVVWENVSWMFL